MNYRHKSFAPLLAGLMLMAGTSASARNVSYTLDPAHTQTQFSWAHLGFSHPAGGFDDIKGTLSWNASDLSKSSVTVTIAVDSIHTHVPALDQELRSSKFFDSARFPTIEFASTLAEPTDDPKRFKVIGFLTVHGIARPVTLDVSLNQTGRYPMLNVPAVGFDASTSFKRSAFGISEGVPMVGDEILVQISTEALEAKGYAKAMKALKARSTPAN
jgi:polyisoprenoid-binding protein YceI